MLLLLWAHAGFPGWWVRRKLETPCQSAWCYTRQLTLSFWFLVAGRAPKLASYTYLYIIDSLRSSTRRPKDSFFLLHIDWCLPTRLGSRKVRWTRPSCYRSSCYQYYSIIGFKIVYFFEKGNRLMGGRLRNIKNENQTHLLQYFQLFNSYAPSKKTAAMSLFTRPDN